MCGPECGPRVRGGTPGRRVGASWWNHRPGRGRPPVGDDVALQVGATSDLVNRPAVGRGDGAPWGLPCTSRLSLLHGVGSYLLPQILNAPTPLRVSIGAQVYKNHNNSHRYSHLLNVSRHRGPCSSVHRTGQGHNSSSSSRWRGATARGFWNFHPITLPGNVFSFTGTSPKCSSSRARLIADLEIPALSFAYS